MADEKSTPEHEPIKLKQELAQREAELARGHKVQSAL